MRIAIGTPAGTFQNEFPTGYGHLLSSFETAFWSHASLPASGGLHITTIVLAELYTWAYRRQNQASIIQRIENDLLPDVTVLDFDTDCAKEFGRVRGQLLQKGISVSRVDLLIGAVALVHNLTMVTHNKAHYQNIPGLRLDDWLTP
jgi:predicted nucleic acid-binding protein